MQRLRHKNGNGSVIGNDAFVSPSTFLDRNSVVMENAEVCCAKLFNSGVYGDARVCGATMESSSAGHHSRVVGKVDMVHAIIRQDARVVSTEGRITLIGTKEKPFIVNRMMWIDRGRWQEPPAYCEIRSREGVVVGITRCVDDRAHVGCKCETLDDWLKMGDDYGRVAGWTAEAVKLLRGVFERWDSQ